MRTAKILVVISIITFSTIRSVFASWWNPFSWGIFTRKQNTSVQEQIIPVSQIPDSLIIAHKSNELGTVSDQKLTLIDTITINSSTLRSEIFRYDNKIIYAFIDPKTLKRIYYMDGKRVFGTNDDVILYDIVDGKRTYRIYDSKNKGSLYIEEKLVATTDADVFNGKPTSFNYQKIANKDVYMTYDSSAKIYTVYIDNKKVVSNLIGYPEIKYINNEFYISGSTGVVGENTTRSPLLFTLYKYNEPIATSEIKDFYLRKIGNEVAYQVDISSIFTLYLGKNKIAEQIGRGISFDEINGKLAYVIMDDAKKTSLYIDEELIAQIDRNQDVNGLSYGNVGGKLYYSYDTFPNESTYDSDGNFTHYENNIYKNIQSIDSISGKIAYIKYDKTSGVRELYLDGKIVAKNPGEFGEIGNKFYYTTYDKEDKKYKLFIDGKLVNANDNQYYLKPRFKNGFFYTTFNKEQKIMDAYFNETKLVSSSTEVFAPGYLNDDLTNSGSVRFFSSNENKEYSLHIGTNSYPILGNKRPDLVKKSFSEPEKNYFYTSNTEGENFTINVYQISE